MKALVTGATGFIGSHLVEVLTDNNWEVRVLVRENSNLRNLDGRNLDRVTGDVRDLNSVEKAAMGVDTIFHAAAMVGEWGAPKDYYDVNVTGMKNVIEAAAAEEVPRFIAVSSTSVHGNEGFNNSSEETPYVKSGILYNDSKVEAEQLVWRAHAEGRIRASTVRPCMVWGPRDRAFMPKIILSCRSRMFMYVNGGNHLAGLAHVRNVCDVIHRCAIKEEALGKAFIVTDGCDTTFRAMVETLCDELGLKKPRLSVPYGVAKAMGNFSENIYRRFHAEKAPLLTKMGVACIGNNLSFDITRARKILGYEPQYRFPLSLQPFLDWFKREYNFSEIR